MNPIDFDLKKEIASIPGGENVMHCFLCGTCTAGCPVSRIDDAFSPFLIMHDVLLGRRRELLQSGALWKCMQCHVCVAHCPQDARPGDVIRVLRLMAVAEGTVPPEGAEKLQAVEDEMKRLRLQRIGKVLSDLGL
jgi:heterodisulfide reductase subunit C